MDLRQVINLPQNIQHYKKFADEIYELDGLLFVQRRRQRGRGRGAGGPGPPWRNFGPHSYDFIISKKSSCFCFTSIIIPHTLLIRIVTY